MISQHTKKTLLEEFKERREELKSWLYGTIHKQYDTEETAEAVQEDVDKYFSDEWLSTKLEEAEKVGREQILEEMMGEFEHPEFCRARGEQFKECARCIFATLSKTEGDK
jgi:hypothetical protein